MKLRSILVACLFSICQLAFADMPPKPESCPSASELQSAFFFLAQKPDDAPGYVAITLGKFGTQDTWGGMMAFFNTDDAVQAVIEANQVKGNIAGNPQPFPVEDQNVWICCYGVKGTDYQVITVTPLNPGTPNAKSTYFRRVA